MELLVRIDGDMLKVAIGGEIDHHEAIEMRTRIDGIILEERPKKVIFDLSRVSFMDSSGIGLVLGRYRLMNSMGGSVAICGASDSAVKIFRMSGVDRLIEIIQ